MRKIVFSILLSVFIILSSTTTMGNIISTNSLENNILYVGGVGPGNYTKIQDAIDNSSEGDTVFVFPDIYTEDIIIDRSIKVIGHESSHPLIYGVSGDTVRIEANNVNFSNFGVFTDSYAGSGLIFLTENNVVNNCTFQGSNDISVQCHYDNNTLTNNLFIRAVVIGSNNNTVENNEFVLRGLCIEPNCYGNTIVDNEINGDPLIYLERELDKTIYYAGQVILVDCSNIEIKNLNIEDSSVGVYLLESNNCTIYNNYFENCSYGVYLDHHSGNNYVLNNNFESCFYGIHLYNSDNNMIHKNSINNSRYFKDPMVYSTSICLYRSDNNVLCKNSVSNAKGYGLFLYESFHNILFYNVLMNNTINAGDNGENYWNSSERIGNYWDDYEGLDEDEDGIGDTPYDNIYGGDNIDYYPILKDDVDIPSVQITAPENYLYLFNIKLGKRPLPMPMIIGKVTIEVNAFDFKSEIDRVEFYIDDDLVKNDTSFPYTYDWGRGSISFLKNTHEIKAIAYDSYGNNNFDEMIVRKFL